jgi:hypothetical protein
MAHGVHTRVLDVQPVAAHSAVDPAASEAQCEQLPPCHHTVLAFGQRSERLITTHGRSTIHMSVD